VTFQVADRNNCDVGAGALLNAVLALQIVVYGKRPAAQGKKKTF
jgi:hypothetical protein